MPKSKKKRDELIRELAALLDETGLGEIEVEDEDLRVRVAASLPFAGEALVPSQVSAPGRAAEALEPAAPAEPVIHPGTVKSPMVGTAYLAPEPGADPFVKVGDTVSEGQDLMIIEAMKVLNPISAPKAGKVLEILVTDGQPVEFDEALIIIE
ncbi:MAG: acetyl-CoA carboxylase biotin carboxyl carrier protein [Sphingomonadales bacterium]